MMTVSAANKIGVRTVLMNTGFAGPQLADVCAREHVSCILVDDEFEDIVNTLPPETLRFTSGGQGELIGNQSTSSLPAPQQPGGMALLTSGTTGTPKGCRATGLTRRNPRSYSTGFPGRVTAPTTSPRRCSMRRVWRPVLLVWSWATVS
jgi:acyl-CoA synthetase (AMP-forming)/AMP-acid ligase II